MSNSDLKIRTKDYALSVIRLFAELPKRTEAQVMGRQLLRSGTSVGAQISIAVFNVFVVRVRDQGGYVHEQRRGSRRF
jgi:hypothetical protein